MSTRRQWPLSIIHANDAEEATALYTPPTVFGVDVSRWQGNELNWSRLKQDGVQFAFIRVGSNKTLKDPNYDRNVRFCLRHDIPFGNYYFLYEDGDPRQQARKFVQQADWRSTLPPVVDVERPNLTAAQIKSFVDEFHRLVEAPPIMIYTRANLWNQIVPRSETWPAAHPLWVADWRGPSPTLPHHWDRWVFHQVGVRSDLSGYPGEIDVNYFNGAVEELHQLTKNPRVREDAFDDYIAFDSPVGTPRERRSKSYPPAAWIDVNPFLNRYFNSGTGAWSIHTGNDLNKPEDADRHAPVYAAADGQVTFAGQLPVWGGVIVVQHAENLFTRYGHVANIKVAAGDTVRRGDNIAIVGHDQFNGPYHLHFDISQTNILAQNPGHWPGDDKMEVIRHYIDPQDYVNRHRPQDTTPPSATRLPPPTRYGFVTATAGLNLRSEPSTAQGERSVVDLLEYGARVGIIDHLPHGWYRVRVGRQNGYVWAAHVSDVESAVSAPTTTLQTGMNVNPDAPHSNPSDSNVLQGLNWVRFVFKLAARVNESERNDINKSFQQYDPIIRSYNQLGVKALVVLNQETVWGNPRDGYTNWQSFVPTFAEVAGQIASHYSNYGDGVAYQIWNEGDKEGNPASVYLKAEEYAQLLEATAVAIRDASPQSPIIFNGMATGPEETVRYIKTCETVLNRSLPVDAIGIHPYTRWATRPPFDWGSQYGTLGDAFRFFKEQIPHYKLWITEIGVANDTELGAQHYPAIADYMTDVYEHVAAQHVRQVPAVIWFAWSDHMRNAGIVKKDGSFKEQIYAAFQKVRGSVHQPQPTTPENGSAPAPPPPQNKATNRETTITLRNGNFVSRDWRNVQAANLNLINQEPEGWRLEWLNPGDLLYHDNNNTVATGVPECVHKLSWQLPEHEQLGMPNALILDGDATYKIFSATASFGATLAQTVTGLAAGSTATLTVPILVVLYNDRDEYGAESGVWVNGVGGWVNAQEMGNRDWYYHEINFTVPENGTAEIVIRVKSKWQMPKDFFIDGITLEAVGESTSPERAVAGAAA